MAQDGKVFVGGDSAGVGGLDLTLRADKKVFKNGEFIFGFTTSFRMGQLLRYSFTPPKRHPDKELFAYMATDFVDAVRDCLKKGGYASKVNEVESGGHFIVGHAGRIFTIEEDYQVGEPISQYSACGCGYAFAQGSLFSSKGLEPRERVELALRTAEAHSAGVRGPFHVEAQ